MARTDDNHAKYDEIRIWNYARTAEQIKANKDVQYGGSLMPQGLIANYKGEVMTIDGISTCATASAATMPKGSTRRLTKCLILPLS